MILAGIDLGGTKIAVAIVEQQSGRVLARSYAPTDSPQGPDAVLQRMATLVHTACASASLAAADLAAVGLGVPGVYDLATGHTHFLPNLAGAWRNVPAGPTLRHALGRPVWLINDARAFVLAESLLGAGRNAHTVVGLTLGTGVGGGIAVDGRLWQGLDGTAGEVGHLTMNLDGPLCACGNRGCLETYASGLAIARLAAQRLATAPESLLLHLAGGAAEQVTPAMVGQAAAANDAVAQSILAQVTRYLGAGVANLVTTLSPDCVILGGSVANLGEQLLAPVRAVVRDRCRAIPVDRVRIVQAELGLDAGPLGAALWAGERTENRP
ncbi:MAG: ROK family protein [Chloroflexi bacterium]|nr:ROK family protein [Chloroflexota bacterium]